VPRELAQTNLQLYDEVAPLGWSETDLVRLRDGYDLVCELFSGMVRPTGKTFVAHLVGTASALVRIGERPAVVLAGLLHAAYTLGEFGDGTRGESEPKRRVVTAAVGPEAEWLVSRYTRLRWAPEVVSGLLERATDLDAEARDVVVMRLANEVDEWVDGGHRYAPAAATNMQSSLDALVSLAERVGLPELGRELRALDASANAAEVPVVLVGVNRGGSHAIPPRSHRPRLTLRARRQLGRRRRQILAFFRR